MHEYAAVHSQVHSLLQKIDQADVQQVLSVRFRRGSTFSEEALRQAFQIFSAGTPLEGATVNVEVSSVPFDCACGHSQDVSADDLVGYFFVCPACDTVAQLPENEDLELLNVEFDLTAGEECYWPH